MALTKNDFRDIIREELPQLLKSELTPLLKSELPPLLKSELPVLLKSELPLALKDYGVLTKKDITHLASKDDLKRVERSLTIKITKSKNDLAQRVATVAVAKEERSKVEKIDSRVTTLESFVYS